MASGSTASPQWRDNHTASPLPFIVGTITLVLFTWVWIDTNYIWHYLAQLPEAPSREELLRTRPVTAEILIYILLGAVTAFLCQPHPWRALGLLPWGGVAFWIMMIIGMMVGYSPHIGRPLFAFIAGILWYVPFATALRRLPYVPLGNGLQRLFDWPAATLLGLICILLFAESEYTLQITGLTRGLIGRDQYAQTWKGIATRAWLLFLIGTIMLLLVIYVFRREMIEALAELVFLPLYRFKVLGPGIGEFPAYGPVVIVANHAAFFDPLWVGKVVPRQITAMMTSVYFDHPLLNYLMKDIVQAIRVEDISRRRESPPEIQEAIHRLDRGECLLIFPEGRMRKRDDELLKHFGQGIWHILKERPQTPVVPIWIEGGWGSAVSYYGGTPPLSDKSKRLDWNRKITLVLGEPTRLDPAVLEKHQTTRLFLMEAVLGLRKYLPKNGLRQGLLSVFFHMR